MCAVTGWIMAPWHASIGLTAIALDLFCTVLKWMEVHDGQSCADKHLAMSMLSLTLKR